MLDLEELQILAQLIDNIDILKNKLEKAYSDNDAETFTRSKNEILSTQKKIADILNKSSGGNLK